MLMITFYEKVLWNVWQEFDETSWWKILVRHFDETFLCDILVRHLAEVFYETFAEPFLLSLLTLDDCWLPLMTVGDCWWLLMTCDYLWHCNNGNGMALWQFRLSLVLPDRDNRTLFLKNKTSLSERLTNSCFVVFIAFHDAVNFSGCRTSKVTATTAASSNMQLHRGLVLCCSTDRYQTVTKVLFCAVQCSLVHCKEVQCSAV